MSKIARVRTTEGAVHYGLVENGGSVRLIVGDIFGEWNATDATISLDSVSLLAPVSPPNVVAIGLNYRAHALESNHPLPERPIIFLKATTTVCGFGDNIMLPKIAPDEVDYECELAIVIGKKAHNVSEEQALDYALGYTCGNDVSQRNCQLVLDSQWARGKSFDTFAPLGPWIETGLEPDQAPLRTRLNGKVMQDSNTSDLIFSCRQLISYISHNMTLLPGTVIMTGTPSGVGGARKPPVYLRPGDVVEVEIDGIGTLRNPVVAEA